jgi:hypothetical protein
MPIKTTPTTTDPDAITVAAEAVVFTEPTPAIGTVVGYVHGRNVHKALVAEINDATLTLCVLPTHEPAFLCKALYNADKAGGTWHWINEG